jgi:hypothetical protein
MKLETIGQKTEREIALECLSGLNPSRADNYKEWVDVGMALHNAGCDWTDWDKWSQASGKYKEGECEAKWRSFNGHSKGLTVASLCKWHKDDTGKSIHYGYHKKTTAKKQKDDDEQTISQKAMEIAQECKLLRASRGRGFIQPKGGRPLELLSRGGGARSWLRAEYFKRYNVPLRDADCSVVIETLLALAEREAVVPVYLRVNANDTQIVIDLGMEGNEALVIDREAAMVTTDHGVLFTRVEGVTAPMPRPIIEADKRKVIESFHTLMGLPLEDSFKLFCWLLQCWQPAAPYMILYLTGGAGNGKTTTTSYLRLIADPLGSDGSRIGKAPKDSSDLIAFSNCCHVLATDNLTFINRDLSDTIAGIATGLGSFTRRLYTNSDIHIIDRMLPQILNGINPGGIQPDVRDRCLHVSLKQRNIILPSGQWWKAARELLPHLIGILAQACRFALSNLDTMPLASEFRMADATRWIAAAQPYLTQGTVWEGLDFADVYRRSREDDAKSMIDDDPLLRIFMDAIEQAGELKGNSQYILWRLEEQAKEAGTLDELKRSGQWPKNARVFGVQLQKYEPLLRDAGIVHTELPRRVHLFQIPKTNGINGNEIPV